jgi:hypothetical protein
MTRYRKLIVAVIALGLLAGKDLLGIELGVTADQVYTGVVAVLGAVGVYQLPNDAA